jgi:uncharacterized membrane protein YciS (DUF1049 family)
VTFVFVTAFIIEALLAARLWLQMTTNAPSSGLEALVISITDVLVSPFRGYETAVIGERASGIFEFSTLVAVEAYLIGTLVIVLMIVATRFLAFSATQAIATKRRLDARKASRITLRPHGDLKPVAQALQKAQGQTVGTEVSGPVTLQTPSTEVTQ